MKTSLLYPMRSLVNACKAVGTHMQVAYDVGREARWDGAPSLIDLLKGGDRKGFLESPDTLYSIGFINIQRGLSYRVTAARSRAFCTVISLHSAGRQCSVEIFNDCKVADEEGISVVLEDNVSEFNAIDTKEFLGMTQVMVRQYFYDSKQSRELSLPVVELQEKPHPARRGRRRVSARYQAASKFLRWRLRMLFGMKYMQYRLGSRLPKNEFISKEEVALLFKGINASLTRIGISTFHYLVCVYELDKAQVLKIYYRPSKNRYFAFCLNNSWMQGLDGRDGDFVYLNSSQMQADNDGGFTLYVGNKDPGLGNFLNLRTCNRGVISFREIGTDGDARRPHCQILQLNEL